MRPEVTAERPPERARVTVPRRDEGADCRRELTPPGEGGVPQGCTREEAEPNLDLVHPGCVERRVNEAKASAVAFVERLPARAVMDVEVVPDHVDIAARVLLRDLLHERHEPCRRTPPNATRYDARLDVERGEQRAGPVADVLELASVDAIANVECIGLRCSSACIPGFSSMHRTVEPGGGER